MRAKENVSPKLRLEEAFAIVWGILVGLILSVLILPEWLPGLMASLSGPEPKVYWYLARSAGIVAYLLLWLSVTMGLMLSSKLARSWPGGATATDLHQFLSLLALGFALFHGLILLGDRYFQFTLGQILVPFATTSYRPLWVGLGQLGFYLALLVTASFYVRRWIRYRVWRVVHYTSFAVYFLATAHGLAAGTDATTPAMIALYSASGLITYFLIIYRILMATQRSGRMRRARAL